MDNKDTERVVNALLEGLRPALDALKTRETTQNDKEVIDGLRDHAAGLQRDVSQNTKKSFKQSANQAEESSTAGGSDEHDEEQQAQDKG